MNYPICIHCNCPILFSGDVLADGRLTCKCSYTVWNITTYSSNTTAPATYDFNEQLRKMKNWKVTLNCRLDGARKPVPQAFQDAFNEGELDV